MAQRLRGSKPEREGESADLPPVTSTGAELDADAPPFPISPVPRDATQSSTSVRASSFYPVVPVCVSRSCLQSCASLILCPACLAWYADRLCTAAAP